MRFGLRAVVDTNVWVSGIAFPDGSPGGVLHTLRAGAFEAVASWELADEIVEVMRRPRMRALGISEADVRDVLVLLAPMLPDVAIDLAIRDPDDAPVVSAAISGAAEAIVTGDKDLLDDADVTGWLTERGIEVVSPTEWLRRIGLPPPRQIRPNRITSSAWPRRAARRSPGAARRPFL